MRAARIHRYGPPDVFVVESIDRPALKPRDLLVEVHAAAVNPIDWKIRSGGQRGAIRYKLPVVLGLDCSGVVVETGPKASQFSVGDEVYCSPTHRRQGTYAEYVCLDEREVAKKPQNVTHFEAASIPLVGLTAWECLMVKARIQPGQRVLILAGSGGVGSIAIQIAKHVGCHVATTCSGRNVELVKSLGADEVLDYTERAYHEEFSDFDVVLEALGGESLLQAREVVRRGGYIAAITGGLPQNTKRYGPTLGLLVTGLQMLRYRMATRLFHGIGSSFVLRRASGEKLGQLGELVEKGAIKPLVDRVFPLDEIADAHRYSETGRARGKIIIDIKGN